MPYRVPVSGVPLLMDPPFAGTLVWLGVAIGWRTLRALGVRATDATRLERGVLSAAVGLGLLQYAAFGLGMAGLLTPTAVWSVLGLLLLLFAREMGRVAVAAARALGSLRRSPPPGWVRLGVLFLAIPLGIAFLLAVCPPVDADGIGYHLTAPKRWLQAGRMVYLPTMTHTNSPMGVEMLFTLALAVWSDTAAKLIHYLLGILTLCAAYALGRRLRGSAFGFTVAAMYLVGTPRLKPILEYGWAYIDLGLALQVTTAALAWLLWSRARFRQIDALRGGTGSTGPEFQNPKSKIQNGSSAGLLWTSALCAGFAASFKLTGAFTGVLLACVVLWSLRRERRGWGASLRTAAGYAAISLLPMTPWLIRSLLQTGNPVWPFASGLFPTRDWSADLGAAYTKSVRYYIWGLDTFNGWDLATRKRALLVALSAIALPTALFCMRARDRDARALVAFSASLVLIATASTGLYLRYHIPALPMLYAGLLLPLAPLIARSRWAHALVLAVTLVNVAGYIQGQGMPLRMAPAAALGRMPRMEYVTRIIPETRIWLYANAHLPPGTPILSAYKDTYYCDHFCYLTDALQQRLVRFDRWDNTIADLERLGIRYVAVYNLPPGARLQGVDYAPAHNEMPYLQRLARASGAPLSAAGITNLYRLAPRSSWP